MKRFPSTLLVGALLAGLAACGGPPASATEPVGLEKAAITVGVLPIVDVAPVYLALERGLFEAEGLTVTVELVQGGAAAIPALVSGDLDVTYGNWVSFLLANQEGIELRAVAAGVTSAPGFTEFLALPDSDLDGDPSRLAGTTVALNTLNNIGELALRSTLRDGGLNIDDVEMLEVPFPEMGAALERRDVDVIWASEPVPTTVKAAQDAVVVADSYLGEMEDFPVAGYQATADFVAEHPHTVAAFQRAMAAAIALMASGDASPLDVIPRYSGLPADVASELALPRYEAEIEAATLARVRDLLVEFGMLEAGMDVEPLVAGSAG